MPNLLRARFDYACSRGCTIRQETGDVMVAMPPDGTPCPTRGCTGTITMRRARVLRACCPSEDGAEHMGNCPVVRRGA